MGPTDPAERRYYVEPSWRFQRGIHQGPRAPEHYFTDSFSVRKDVTSTDLSGTDFQVVPGISWSFAEVLLLLACRSRSLIPTTASACRTGLHYTSWSAGGDDAVAMGRERHCRLAAPRSDWRGPASPSRTRGRSESPHADLISVQIWSHMSFALPRSFWYSRRFISSSVGYGTGCASFVEAASTGVP